MIRISARILTVGFVILAASLLKVGTAHAEGWARGGYLVGRRAAAVAVVAAAGNGYIGQSATDNSHSEANNVFHYSTFTVISSSAGALNYGHVEVNSTTGQHFTLGLYDSSGNRLAYANGAAITNAEAWFTAQLNIQYTITAGVTYIIGCVTDDTAYTFDFKGSVATSLRSISMTYGVTPAASFDPLTSTLVGAGNAYTIVFDNQNGTPK